MSLVFETNFGNFEVELFEKEAPISAKNFQDYVDDGFFDGVIFHRVIPGFMIQGGGFEPGMKQKKVRAPIKNEATNGLKNERGTLSMARTSKAPLCESRSSMSNVMSAGDTRYMCWAPAEPGVVAKSSSEMVAEMRSTSGPGWVVMG